MQSTMSALSNQLEAKRSTSQWTHQIFAEKSINTSQIKTFLKDDHSNCTHKSKGGQCTRSTNKKSLSYEGQTLERKRNTAWTIHDEWQQNMNDSRTARRSANKITKKTSPKSAQKNRTSNNKRWLKEGLRKSPPKEALRTQTILLSLGLAEKNNWSSGSSTKYYQKKGTLQRELWSAEKKRTTQKKKCPHHQNESLKTSRQWRSTTRLDPLQSKGKANKNRH